MSVNTNSSSTSYNWESLIATLGAIGGAVGVNLTSGIPGSVQAVVVAFAGLLTSLHLHVPTIVSNALGKVVAPQAAPTPTSVLSPNEQAVVTALRNAYQNPTG